MNKTNHPNTKNRFKKKGIAALFMNGECVDSKVFLSIHDRKQIFTEYNKRIKPLKYYHEIRIDVTYDNATINQFLTKTKDNA